MGGNKSSDVAKEHEQDARSGCRTVVGIRTHRPGPDVNRVYNWLIDSVPPEDIFLIVDETENKKFYWDSKFNLIPFNEKYLDSLGLHIPHNRVGWQCGDYFYIALKDKVDFEYAWLIEPDVAANFPFRILLDKAQGTSADLVSAALKERDGSWNWFESMRKSGHDKVYSAFYPLTRLSRKLISLVHEERVRSKALFEANTSFKYPNDEAVTATIAVTNNCTTFDLRDSFPDMFSHFIWGNKWLVTDVSKKFSSYKLIHPVLEEEQFADYLKSLVSTSSSVDLNKLTSSLWSVSAVNYQRWIDFIADEFSASLRNRALTKSKR